MKTVHGIIRGNTIELSEDIGVAEGQEVEVQVKIIDSAHWGAGLKRSAGALASEWTEEDDQILADIHQARQNDSRRELPE